ncbi:MAG: TatD family hydrolase [Pseudobdellovibrionaceae bacterium]
MWYDIHAHLNMLEDSPEVSLQKAADAGVEKVITIGTEPKDHQVVLDLARKFYPKVYCTLGVHPHEGAVYNNEVEKWLDQHLPEKEVVAVGEIGLDYYYNNSPVEAQKEAFRRQLALAKRHKMPVQIHTRDAEQDTVDIIKEFAGEVVGVIHCFTSSKWLAEEALRLGYNISFSGIVTFKNANDLREVAKMVPLDRMHVETDAPFLAPVPQRGKKNTPAFVVHTAELVATLKGITKEQLAEATCANAKKMFPKMK